MQRRDSRELSSSVGLRPSQGVLSVLLVMTGVFLVNAIAHPAFVRDHLALIPRRALGAEPWQLLSSAFVHLDFGGLFGSALALLFFGTPIERQLGRTRFFQLFVSSTILGALATAGLGRIWAPDALFAGAGPAAMGMIAAFGALWGATPIALFGIQHMKASTCAWIFLGISTAMYLMNYQLYALFGALVGAGMGWLATGNLTALTDGLRARREAYKKQRIRRRYKVLSGGRDSRGILN